MVTRRRFLQGAAAVAGAPAIIGRAWAAEPLTFITPFGFDPFFIDMMNAYSGGHFARQGLDAKVIGAPGTSSAFQQVISGQAQFSLVSSLDFIRAVAAKDAPLQAVATIGQNSGFNLISLKDKPVKSGADLRGKTIGILSVGGLTETMVDILAAKAGVPKSETKVVVAGNSPGEVEFIRHGRIDCFLCNFTVTLALQRANADVEYLSIDSEVPAPGQLYYCARETIAAKPAYVTAVLKAMRASVDEIIAGPIAPIFERAGKDFEIPGIADMDRLVALEKAAIERLWYGQGKENLLRNVPALWQSGVDAMRAVGIVKLADASSLYTNRFIDEVLKG
jgi:NitT/TauT family transport system substrate-binding protein